MTNFTPEPGGSTIQLYDFLIPAIDAPMEVEMFVEVTTPGYFDPLTEATADLTVNLQ
jgi:hypothetical protein